MKCVRDTGMGYYAIWSAKCKKAQREMRKYRKFDYNYLDMTLPRYRIRKRALLDLRKSDNHMIFWSTRRRLIRRYFQEG